MPTNLRIDEELMQEALRLGGHKTKRETVDEALREYIRRRQRIETIDHFGSFEFDEQYDYKKNRE